MYYKKINFTSLCVTICLIVGLLSSCSNSTKNQTNITKAQPLTQYEMKDKGYVKNIASTQSNVLEYQKADGSKSLFVFSAPVENSFNNISSQTEDYYCSNGTLSIKKFPKNMSETCGISIKNENIELTVLPYNSANYLGKVLDKENVFDQKENCVDYADMFDNGINYTCYPTSFGINTEVNIQKRTQIESFRIKFRLSENVIVDTTSPDYIIFKTALENGTVKAIIYSPLAVDSKGKWCYENTVKLVEKDSNANTYTVEYSINKDFLNADDTKYPVKINQSICIYIPKQPDTSTYSKTGDEARHYLSPYMLLGDSTVKGEGWTFIRYETLEDINLKPEDIISAKYSFYNPFDLKEKAVISTYAVTADWCSINTMWFNRPTYDEDKISSVNIKEKGVYQLDLTPLIKRMLENVGNNSAKYTVNNSFLIKCDSDNSNIILPSGDNGLFSPYLEIQLKP